MFEELDTGFTLLAFGADAATLDAARSLAAQLNLSLQIIADDAAGERADYGARLVLVRPDQFVAWAGDAWPADAASVFKKAMGA